MRLALAIGVAYLAAVIGFRFIARKGRIGRVALIITSLAILLSPCLIPAGRPLPRFLAAVVAVAVAVKLFDLRHDVRRGDTPGWSTFLGFLANPFIHVRRCLPAEPQPSVQTDLQRLAAGTVGLLAGAYLLYVLFQVDWDRFPFLVEHLSKVAAFFLAVFSGLALLVSGWRLLGGRGRDYMANPLAARTPADFWRRYNRNMHQFFLRDVFVPVGGLRNPVRATLLVFVLSAIIHEYVFGIAIGRVQGYQTAFFLLQGLAVVATASLKTDGTSRLPWMAATLAFNCLTSVLFFASMAQLVPFYAHGLPVLVFGH